MWALMELQPAETGTGRNQQLQVKFRNAPSRIRQNILSGEEVLAACQQKWQTISQDLQIKTRLLSFNQNQLMTSVKRDIDLF